jgi:hypothetical protein
MVPRTTRTSRSPSPSRQPPADGGPRTSGPTSRITQAHLDPSDHRTIACVAVVLGPADAYAYHCLACLQTALDERVQVVELGTEDDRLLHVQRALSGRIGPGTVALVIQCGTGGQAHPDLASLKDTFNELVGHADGTGLTAPVVVCSDENLREETCIAQVIAQRRQIDVPVRPSLVSRPSQPQASDLSPPSLVDLPWPALVAGPPVGLVLVKIGRLSGWDENLVDELTDAIGNMPMVCTRFRSALAAMKNLEDLHANRGTPQTEYIILCDGSRDADVVNLCAALLLKLNVLARTYSHANDSRSVPHGVADRAAQAYAKALIEHDQRYLDKFKDWAIDLDNHKGNPMALYQYLVQVLALSRDDVLGEVDLCFKDPDLWGLPPLPPRNITRLSLIGCPIAWIRGLPVTLRALTISHPIMVSVDIDPSEVPLLEWVDLRGLGLWRTPPWVDELPDDVEVLLPYPSSGDELFDVDPGLNDEPGATHLSDDEPERGTFPITEALRHWSDTPTLHVLEQDWQRLESLPGASEFARLLVKLSQDARFASEAQGARIANLLSSMRADLALARLIMEVAVGADETCIDRASLTWHFVELACESHTLLQGRPLSLPTIIEHARQVLRRTLLMDKANKKIKQLRDLCASQGKDPDTVDEVEVVLAFLEWSQGALQIRKNPYAQFTRTAISKVEMREVSVAVREIRAFEDAQFEVFLTDWKPWRDVLSTLQPERMEAIEQACSDIDGIDTAARRDLAQQGVSNADTAIVSSQDRTRISNAIRREGAIKLTQEVLEEHRHVDLLGPYWASH